MHMAGLRTARDGEWQVSNVRNVLATTQTLVLNAFYRWEVHPHHLKCSGIADDATTALSRRIFRTH
jgi:LmbE family N-acetylglucosaminyl deacetylase